MRGVSIFLADGFEDMEALSTRDVLKRGGVDVHLVGIGDEPFVSSSHGLIIGVDDFLEDLDDDSASREDVMIFPGGMPGSRNLAKCRPLIDGMKAHYAAGGTLAAICAAPGLVLGQLGDLDGVQFTCFDGFEDGMIAKGASFVKKPAVVSDRIITGRSAGHAVEFALAILEYIRGEKVAAEVRYGLNLTCE